MGPVRGLVGGDADEVSTSDDYGLEPSLQIREPRGQLAVDREPPAPRRAAPRHGVLGLDPLGRREERIGGPPQPLERLALDAVPGDREEADLGSGWPRPTCSPAASPMRVVSSICSARLHCDRSMRLGHLNTENAYVIS